MKNDFDQIDVYKVCITIFLRLNKITFLSLTLLPTKNCYDTTTKRTTHSALDLFTTTFLNTLHARIKKTKNQTHEKANKKIVTSVNSPEVSSGQLVVTLESGMALGSGEYFVDVLVGTPPKHFSLILDTGSDLNWLQCLPCYDCFQQNGAFYDPKHSASFKNITCSDPRCGLISSPEPQVQCETDNQSCPYFYWYGEVLDIPEETWNISSEDGRGGTIIDSGTTLSYFAEPAYEIIKNMFTEKVKDTYPVFRDFSILDPCFNVSGVKKNYIQLPQLGITFADGAVWNFPAENSCTWLNEDLVCLAILGTPKSAFSIIGNYQQQNFHILYDTKKSRLGFAPTKCTNI